jgi:glycosyltransferase involved in cell wall biosynthesis
VKPRVAVLAYPSPLEHDNRMRNEAHVIRSAGIVDEVILIGTLEGSMPGAETTEDGCRLIRLPLLTGSRRIGKWARTLQILEWQARVVWALRKERVAFFVPHNLAALPPGCVLKLIQGTGLVYEPIEVETERGWPGPLALLGRLVERLLVRWASAVIVVSEATGEWYRSKYGLTNVVVVHNFPSKRIFPVGRNDAFRASLGIPSDAMLFIYHGLLARSRGVDTILEVFSRLDAKHHMLFIGFGELADSIRARASTAANVHYQAAIPQRALLSCISAGDAGFHLLERANLNHSLTIANKPFEYLAAGLPVVESSHTEVARVLAPYDCAWFVDERDIDSLVALLSGLDRSQVDAKRANALAARNEFTWEGEIPKLLEAYTHASVHRTAERHA